MSVRAKELVTRPHSGQGRRSTHVQSFASGTIVTAPNPSSRLIVNQAGQRFVDEAAPYGDVVNAMYKQNAASPGIPCWLIVDQNYRDRYLFDETLATLPLPSSWYSAGTVYSSYTIAGLANAIGVPAANLEAAITRFNGFAATGVDSDFSRGVNFYDH